MEDINRNGVLRHGCKVFRQQQQLQRINAPGGAFFRNQNNPVNFSWSKRYFLIFYCFTSFTKGNPCSKAYTFSMVVTAMACSASLVKNAWWEVMITFGIADKSSSCLYYLLCCIIVRILIILMSMQTFKEAYHLLDKNVYAPLHIYLLIFLSLLLIWKVIQTYH